MSKKFNKLMQYVKNEIGNANSYSHYQFGYKQAMIDVENEMKRIWEEESRLEKLETLAKLLAKTWFYGEWDWETPNERIMQMLMTELGYYPFSSEDEMIKKTGAHDELYKIAVDKVPIGKPRQPLIETDKINENE